MPRVTPHNLTLFLASLLLVLPALGYAATLSLSPSSGSFAVGDFFNVSVLLDTSGAAVDGFDFNYLNYNSALLEVQDADAIQAGVQISAGVLLPVTAANSVDAALGRIRFSQLPSGGSTFSGSGTVAQVRFKVKAAGTASASFNFTPASTLDTNVASAGADVLTSASGASFVLSVGGPPPDTTPPTVSISAPAAGATVSGTSVAISANAADNVAVAGVQFKLDGANLGAEDTAAPYTITWNTTTASNGAHTLTAVARDTSGLTTTSGAITVTVNNVLPDITPPVISLIASSAITASGATVSWTTNEAATTQVEYGTSPCPCASNTSLDVTLILNHSVSLSGLTGGTKYYYRAKSRDSAGNLAASGDQTFNTLTPVVADSIPPSAITNLGATSVTVNSAILSWSAPGDDGGVGTAAAYDIRYAASVLTEASWASVTQSSGEPVPLVSGSAQSFTLSGLNPGTTYWAAIKTKDDADNLSGLSNVIQFSTNALPPSGGSGASGSAGGAGGSSAADTTPPVISSIATSNISDLGLNITWVTNEGAEAEVEYGLTASYGASANRSGYVQTHFVQISGLQAGALYHYRIKSRDVWGNLKTSVDYTFRTRGESATPVATTSSTPAPASVTPPLSAESVFTATLKFGSEGGEVKKLQEFLAREPAVYPEGRITGYFGKLTERAVERFQEKYGIASSQGGSAAGYGIVGAATRAKLNELFAAGSMGGAATPVAPSEEDPELIKQLLEQIRVLQIRILELQIKLLQQKIAAFGGVR